MCPRMGDMIGNLLITVWWMIFVFLEESIPDDEKNSRKCELMARNLQDTLFKLENDISFWRWRTQCDLKLKVVFKDLKK